MANMVRWLGGFSRELERARAKMRNPRSQAHVRFPRG